MPTASNRASIRPNSTDRNRYRMALQGRPCSTCLLPVAWDGAVYHRHAGSADLAHRISSEECGRYDADVIVVQCHACNDAARIAGLSDLTEWIVSEPYSLPSREVAKAWRATWVPEDATGLPGATAREWSRRARGCPF